MSASQVPTHHVAPRADRTFGDLAADLAADYNLGPDPWQRLVLDDWLAQRDGRWASLTCGLALPRQNGKNVCLEIRELFGTVGRGEKILHTAHQVKTAQKHFRRLKYFFGAKREDPNARFPELNALVAEVRNVNGQEAIYLRNGGSIEIVARSKDSGRGFTVDTLVLDEAQELSEEALEALMPTTSAAPLGNPQWIFTGTPPGPMAIGEVFTRVRIEAHSARPGRICWHEWSVSGSVDLDDRAHWFATNPTLGIRLDMGVLEGERARFSDDGFARERLGRWAEDFASAVLQRSQWLARRIPADRVPAGKPSYGVRFSPDGARVALAVALRPDTAGDPTFVEVIDSGSTAVGIARGADWLAARWSGCDSIVVDGRSGAGALVDALVARGVPLRWIVRPTADQAVTANTKLLEAVHAATLVHTAQPGLTDAVIGAGRRAIGTTGGWGFTPVSPDIDITPIEAIALAHYGATSGKRRENRRPGSTSTRQMATTTARRGAVI